MSSSLKPELVFLHTKRTKTHRNLSQDCAPHKMAAGIIHPDQPKKLHLDVNHIPDMFKHVSGRGQIEIGKSSMSLHAETANYRDFPHILGGEQFVAEDLCTNCAKNAVVSGIAAIFRDVGALSSHYRVNHARKSAGKVPEYQFDILGKPVLSAYGVKLYDVNRRTCEITPLNPDVAPMRTYPRFEAFREKYHPEGLKHYMEFMAKKAPDQDWSILPVKTSDGQQGYLIGYEALPPGHVPGTDITLGKFTQSIDSLCNVTLTTKRLGMTMIDGSVGGNFLPYPRQLIDAVAYGMTNYQYMQPTGPDRLNHRLEAATFINQKKIAHIRSITGAPLAYTN